MSCLRDRFIEEGMVEMFLIHFIPFSSVLYTVNQERMGKGKQKDNEDKAKG